jgi:hypothetical protein
LTAGFVDTRDSCGGRGAPTALLRGCPECRGSGGCT